MDRPLPPVMVPYDPDGPLADYARLMDLHRDLYAMPRMNRATAAVHVGRWQSPESAPTVDWEGQPWWSGVTPPQPAIDLERDAGLFRFSMPTIDENHDWMQTINLDPAGIVVEISGYGSLPSYLFHMTVEDGRWSEGCVIKMTHMVMTDVIAALGRRDMTELLESRGLRIPVGCPIFSHAMHDGILQMSTTTIVFAALRDDASHHDPERIRP